MKVITITGLKVKFDADQEVKGIDMEQARQVIEQINFVLQHHDFNGTHGAQIFGIITPSMVRAEYMEY